MTGAPTAGGTMQALRFHQYGDPTEVLRLEDAPIPAPSAGQVRVRVHACGLNPADWALCLGLFASALPRGVGLDVSGTVDAVGEGVADVQVGDRVLGPADYSGYESAGAAEHAILTAWTPVPEGLGMVEAAALPMAVETASRCLDVIEFGAGQTVLVYGAGTMMGFAAVQMALTRGARVVAVAGETFAGELQAMGVAVTPYGDGLVERALALCGGSPDAIADMGPISPVLPDLVRIAGGDGQRVVTVSNHGEAAEALGVRNSFRALRLDAYAPFAQLAAEGRFRIPIAGAFPLADWREALALSLSRHAHGKLVLLPG